MFLDSHILLFSAQIKQHANGKKLTSVAFICHCNGISTCIADDGVSMDYIGLCEIIIKQVCWLQGKGTMVNEKNYGKLKTLW